MKRKNLKKLARVKKIYEERVKPRQEEFERRWSLMSEKQKQEALANDRELYESMAPYRQAANQIGFGDD